MQSWLDFLGLVYIGKTVARKMRPLGEEGNTQWLIYESDIEIARAAREQEADHGNQVRKLALPQTGRWFPYGHDKAKCRPVFIAPAERQEKARQTDPWSRGDQEPTPCR